MIGVAQDERGVDPFEMFRCEGLDRGLCANWRENWRLQFAVRRGEYPRAGTVIFGCNLKFKHGDDYTVGATRLV